MINKLLFLSFLLILVSKAGLSQEFDVREFTADPSDLAAIRYPKTSVNDEPCAIVKVITNIKGMQFDSNLGIVDMVHQEEGYWLYVAPRERRLRLMAEGFLPLDIPLPEPAVQNKVYNLIVAASGLAGNLDVVPVNFIVEGHSDAVIIIGEDTFPVDQTLQLTRGLVDIRIEKPGYRPVETQIDISEINTLFRYTLEGINEEVVTIRSNPPGASVYIDNVKRNGSTPLQEFLFPGTYNLRLTLNEYNDLDTRILVQEKQNNEFIFDLQKFVGTLTLEVNPSDARITINQRNYTGQNEIQFAPGTYRILVEKPGFYSHEDRILIEEGKSIHRAITLTAKTGTLRFISQSPDATYKLKNSKGEVVSQWSGMRLFQSLPVGEYTYEGELKGYSSLKGNLTVVENQEIRVEAIFTEDQRLAYIREQEKIANDIKRQEDLQKAEQARIAREEQQKEEVNKQKRKERTRKMFAQHTYSTFNLSYTTMNLNTAHFAQNIESNAGIGLGMTGVFDYWAMNMNMAYNEMILNQSAASLFGVDEVSTFTYSFTMGPSLRLLGFELFALAGFEGSLVSSEAFEYDEVSAGDAIIEYGAIFKPVSWGVGLRYGASFSLDLFDGYPPFARQEFGIVVEF